MSRHLIPGHLEQNHRAPCKRYPGPHGHQRVHVRRPMHQTGEAADKKLLVDHHHDGCQDHLHQSDPHRIPLEECRQRPAPHAVPHGKIHENQQKSHRTQEAALQHRRLVIPESLLFPAEIHCAAFFPRSFPVHGRRIIARIPDGLHHRLGGRCAFHPHGVRQQTDRTLPDPRHAVHCLLHPGLTGRTAHSCYCILIQSLPPVPALTASSSAAVSPALPPMRHCRFSHHS